MKRREYLKTASEDEKEKQFKKLRPMINDLKSSINDFFWCPDMKQNTITVLISNGIIIKAYLTNEAIEIYGDLPSDAEKLLKVAIPYWLNQEIEEYKGLLNNEPLNPDEVEYEYYHVGDEPPRELPAGCQFEYVTGDWDTETDIPDYWGGLRRRWPKVKS